MQCPHHLVLVKPRDFAFNAQTAVSNAFQQEKQIANHLQLVNHEFENLLQVLDQNNITYTVFDSPAGVQVPDAVFPNNWFAVMPGGHLVIFPMFAPNRQLEVNPLLLDELKKQFAITQTIDLTIDKTQRRPLEGTGSIVFDHDNRLAYACESDRTHIGLFEELCAQLGYTPVSFLAVDLNGLPVYHTNVVMSVGSQVVVACMQSIADPFEATLVRKRIEASGKTLVEITYPQMNRFCGNVLQVSDRNGGSCWLMSSTAYGAFEPEQLAVLSLSGTIVQADIRTIETLGGGSLRCMLAGVHVGYVEGE